jgi:transcriptional regulator with XRE-family HTH domain
MDPEELTLEIFLRDRMKDKGISLKRLSDLSGISINHIENMLRGDFEHVPPTPYFRGYLIRLGEILNFDGEAWWEKIKKDDDVKKSGPADSLPRNRFTRESPARIIGIAAAILVLLVMFGFALPHILGKPTVSIVLPQGNPYVTTSDSVVIQGSAENTDSLLVNGDDATISSNGSWQKNVLLQEGMNTFDISAKKFLGGTTDIIEQIIYNPPATASSSPSSITVSSSTESASTTIQ